jgi:hypothetical protein
MAPTTALITAVAGPHRSQKIYIGKNNQRHRLAPRRCLGMKRGPLPARFLPIGRSLRVPCEDGEATKKSGQVKKVAFGTYIEGEEK